MERIKELRERHRLSQLGLGIELNVSQSTISAYETGTRTPDLKTLIAIANLFNVSLEYLVGLSDTKHSIRRSDLSADELELLHKYKQADTCGRERIQGYIDGILSK